MSTRKCFVHPSHLWDSMPVQIIALGMEGYGIFNRLLEMMAADKDLRVPLKDIDRWAADMGVSIITLTRFIHKAVDECVLSITDDEKLLFSPWLITQKNSTVEWSEEV